MRILSSTDLALALALKGGTLRAEARFGRFGSYVALSDNAGLIEVHNTQAEADARLAAIKKAAGL
jgi:hypothetical protein